MIFCLIHLRHYFILTVLVSPIIPPSPQPEALVAKLRVPIEPHCLESWAGVRAE